MNVAALARAVTDGITILATGHVAAPPQRVYQALTTNEAERWWGSADTYRVTDWQADLTIGGRWSLNVRLPDGSVLPASGEFLEIEAPLRLVLTRKYDWDFPELGRRLTKVTYGLDATELGTRMTVRHDGFGGLRAASDQHAIGWERFLEWLAAYLNQQSWAETR